MISHCWTPAPPFTFEISCDKLKRIAGAHNIEIPLSQCSRSMIYLRERTAHPQQHSTVDTKIDTYMTLIIVYTLGS